MYAVRTTPISESLKARVVSRIFISHSSVDNAAALAVAQWLRDNGWDDYFLDMTPTRGLVPGVRWQEELKAAAHRCEAVLLLVSPAWRDSEWCQAEFLLARLLGVAILPVLVQPTPVGTLRPEMAAELQIGDLVTGDDRVIFEVSHPNVPPAQVAFSRSGLEGLKQGLQKAGLDPTTFAWPPPDQPRRPPYPGLRPLDVEDAAVFFGRDAKIIEGLNTLRGLRERGFQRMLVILGASGAGKSSFLRAGLWPRLLRDDRQFLPLPVIRPERAAISGTTGLAAVLEAAFLKYRKPSTKPRTRADIRGTLQQAEGLDLLLCELQELARPRAPTDERPPTVVIAIDQAEELFAADGRTEAMVLLARLAETLGRPAGVDSDAIATRRRSLVVVTIRSDSYELLQTESKLAHVDPYLFSLPPLEPADYRTVIEGPAVRASSTGSRLRIEPQLTERLLNDTRGADALPLLAFTLERLFLECGGDGDLRLDEYESLGGVRGSLDAAIAAAFAEPGRTPAIPEDEAERERRLRQGFIPWLALVDPDTRERKRRVARWDEIPEAAQPLLERLVAARLLTRDRRRTAEAEQEIDVVEIAHEALLRQWDSLTRWLDEDAGQLMLAQTVRRAAREWSMNGRHADWLSHTGERLREAEILRERSSFAGLLGAEGQAYLRACRERDDADLQAELEARQRELEDARRLKRALAAADLVAGLNDVKDGRADLALARLARAVRLAPEHVTLRGEAVGLLTRAVVPRAFLMHHGPVRSACFSPDGSRVITASVDKTARVWDATTGQPVGEPLRHDDSVEAACFSPDGLHAVTASRDKTARVWDATTGRPAGGPLRHESAVLAASFSPDGSRVVTASQDKTARIWDAAAGLPVGQPLRHERTVHAASFSPDGSRVVTASDDKTARVWDAATGRPLGKPLQHRKGICIASFSPDGARVLTAGSLDDPAQVWDATTGEPVGEPMRHDSTVSGACFSPDGSRVVTASWDRTARMWDAATGQPVGEPLRHPGEVFRVGFSADGSRVITTSDDKSARVWDAAAGMAVGEPLRHDGSVTAVAFSPDGSSVVTASGWHGARVGHDHRAADGRASPPREPGERCLLQPGRVACHHRILSRGPGMGCGSGPALDRACAA